MAFNQNNFNTISSGKNSASQAHYSYLTEDTGSQISNTPGYFSLKNTSFKTNDIVEVVTNSSVSPRAVSYRINVSGQNVTTILDDRLIFVPMYMEEDFFAGFGPGQAISFPYTDPAFDDAWSNYDYIGWRYTFTGASGAGGIDVNVNDVLVAFIPNVFIGSPNTPVSFVFGAPISISSSDKLGIVMTSGPYAFVKSMNLFLVLKPK